jgi:hypothetical protein
MAKALCLFGASCQAMLGTVEVTTDSPVATPPVGPGGTTGSGGSGQGGSASTFPGPSMAGAGADPLGGGGRPPIDPGPPPGGGSGNGGTGVDAGTPVEVAGPIVVEGPVELERVGVDGGEPRLGVCQGGVVIGIRPTANPSLELFGQRLTFIEPICGAIDSIPSGLLGDPAGASVSLIRDDSILNWEDTGGFLGVPATEVPDPLLLWELQPEAICPESAPVVVGLSGEYDPAAPDVPDTAAFRSLIIECAPLVVAPDGIGVIADIEGHQVVTRPDTFAASGSAVFFSSCSEGAVMTQIHVDAGFWLDGFMLGCSSLRRLLVPGESCSAAVECRSRVCGADGTCSD